MPIGPSFAGTLTRQMDQIASRVARGDIVRRYVQNQVKNAECHLPQ